MENQMGENHEMFSYISKYYIHRKNQIPRFSSTNWKEALTSYLQVPISSKLQLLAFSSSKWKEAPNP
jgi:hypothetical protein